MAIVDHGSIKWSFGIFSQYNIIITFPLLSTKDLDPFENVKAILIADLIQHRQRVYPPENLT